MSAVFQWLGKAPADLGEIPPPPPGAPATAEELSSFSSWRAGDPRFLRWVLSGRDIIGYDLYCPSWTPEPGSFIERNYFDTPARYGFSSVGGVHYVKRVLWATQRACYGPIQVETVCQPGYVRWRNQATGRDECFSCAAPLIVRFDASGRPYCARRPALRAAPQRPPPVTTFRSPVRATLRGVFEWLGAPEVTVVADKTYSMLFRVPAGQLACADVPALRELKQNLVNNSFTGVVSCDTPGEQPPCVGTPRKIGNDCVAIVKARFAGQAVGSIDVAQLAPGLTLMVMRNETDGVQVYPECQPGQKVQIIESTLAQSCVDPSVPCPAGTSSRGVSANVEICSPPIQCRPDQLLDATNTCVSRCPAGESWDPASNSCRVYIPTCASGQVLVADALGRLHCMAMSDIPPSAPAPPACTAGQVLIYSSDYNIFICEDRANIPGGGAAPAPTTEARRKSSAGPLIAGVLILGLAGAIFAATVSGTRVTAR